MNSLADGAKPYVALDQTGSRTSRFVITRHSRSQNGVASLAYDRAIQ